MPRYTLGGKKPYVHTRGGYDTSLDDAMGSFAEEQSMRNAALKQSRARVRQARRGG